jgi:hypothetical protein
MQSEDEREALAAVLERHMAAEGEILEKYHSLSDKLAEGPLSVLVNHIVTEEEMHHFLLRTLSDWLRTPPTPAGTHVRPDADRDEILRCTRALRGHEMKTIEACQSLKSELSGEEAELFDSILEAVSLDSEKHHRLLLSVEKLIGR